MPRATHDRIRIPASQHEMDYYRNYIINDDRWGSVEETSVVKHEDDEGNTYLFTRKETKEVYR